MASGRTHQAEISKYVGALQGLHDEISAAVACVACNALGELEQSLWRQEMLCAVLKRSAARIASMSHDTAARQQLREAMVALRSQSQAYEAVVRQCSRSSMILRDLYGLYAGASSHTGTNNSYVVSCEA